MKTTGTRLALAAFAALLGLGIALHGDSAGARLGDARHEPTSFVVATGEEDLANFAAVDMADALGRVAGDPAAPRSESH